MSLEIKITNKKGTKTFLDIGVTVNNLPIAMALNIGFLWDKGATFKSADILESLESALSELSDNKVRFGHLNPVNGWGGVDSMIDVLSSMVVVMLNGNVHTTTYTDMETCLKYATQFSSMNGVKYAMCSGEDAK